MLVVARHTERRVSPRSQPTRHLREFCAVDSVHMTTSGVDYEASPVQPCKEADRKNLELLTTSEWVERDGEGPNFGDCGSADATGNPAPTAKSRNVRLVGYPSQSQALLFMRHLYSN